MARMAAQARHHAIPYRYNCIAQLVTRPRRPSCLHTLEVFPAMYICACPHRALVLITVVHCLQMAEDCNSAA